MLSSRSFVRLHACSEQRLASACLPLLWSCGLHACLEQHACLHSNAQLWRVKERDVSLLNLLSPCSEFVSAELAPGTVARGLRHEDLQRTSFADNTFDLVISSEVRPA